MTSAVAQESPGPVERLGIDHTSPWWGEHRSRYRFADELLPADGLMLDIASGTGFGTTMLTAGSRRTLIGCDASVDAAIAARRCAKSTAAHFVATDGLVLPFADETFDAVVSFETIEHVIDGPKFVSELRRVLQRNGVLVLSTPNVDVTSAYPRNPFHLHEYTAAELQATLGAHFENVRVVGQNLGERYRVAPFLPGHDRARTAMDVVRLATWKVAHRLPFSMKDSAARLVLGRSFYPSETDFRYDADHERAHVLVAVCRP